MPKLYHPVSPSICKELVLKKLFSLLVFVALLLAACGGGSGEVAATVDEASEVTVGDIEGLIDTGDSSTIAKDRFANFLGFEIQLIILKDASAADFGTSFTDEEVAAEAEAFYTQTADPGTSREEFLSSNGITEAFLQRVARQRLIQISVNDSLESQLPRPSQEQIDSQLEVAADSLLEVCARHILVETEAEALEVLDRLDGGESFEDLALELSQDPGSGQQGGDLGCSHPSRYVPEFDETTRTAAIGEVTDPVETDFGFHLILVYERNEPEPTEDEIIASINAAALGQAVNDWFLAAVTGATVEVNEKYGTWETEPVPTVVPPA
jgi:parvulin-like peptidyl-prolyl isomerase